MQEVFLGASVQLVHFRLSPKGCNCGKGRENSKRGSGK